MPRETRVLTFSEDELVWAIHNLAAQSNLLDIPEDIVKIVPFEDSGVSVGLEFADDRYSVLNESELGAALILHCVRVGVPMPKNANKTLRVSDGHIELVITIQDGDKQHQKEMQGRAAAAGAPRTIAPDPHITNALARWMGSREDGELVAPWRKDNPPWLVLVGILLFGDSAPRVVQSAWPIYRDRWPDPRTFLADDRKRVALDALNKAGAAAALTVAARILARDENGLAKLEADAASNIPRAVSRTAFALAGRGEAWIPVDGVVRVAARALGFTVQDLQNIAGDDQQRLVDCLVTGDESGRAYGAALEIADQFCHETLASCPKCPLAAHCPSAKTEDTGAAQPQARVAS